MIRRVTAPALFPPPARAHASVVEAGTELVGTARLVETAATALVPEERRP